ncbi:beta-glucosidase 15-like [Mercurialis annua]|uniref:beta-glucosidase 15-like n=1 Tax=Mercurialis annua TaxID=3986 RepID=UPI00215E7EF5|nr:beta-glucosidase 15-like [Mercurialis annua]
MQYLTMKFSGIFCVIINLWIVSIVDGQATTQKGFASVTGSSFPADFLFGSASSSHQYEGGALVDGRGPSMWDTYVQKHPERVADRSNADIAVDSYHRYKEDVAIIKDIGFNAHRFSISWSRILPHGKLSGGVNQAGIDYYNNLINELLAKGIQPFATLFHWDIPQALEDEYMGFLNIKIVDDFRDYADLCFSKFGDRVKHWITLNEPQNYAVNGYSSTLFAPARCSDHKACGAGDSSTEPYIVTHNQILAHAAAVRIYRDKYQKTQKGQIGITLNFAWILPYTESSKQDQDAAFRAIVFQYDWYMEPLKSGTYPAAMVTRVGNRLPRFSTQQSWIVKGSYDFIGLNYYTAQYASDVPCPTVNHAYITDSCASLTSVRNGVPIGYQASIWLYVYAPGIEQILLYTKTNFNDPIIYITENGINDPIGTVTLNDNIRIDFINNHLVYIQKAIASGVKVKGYFAWSLLDNWEWSFGFSARFGVVSVDHNNGLKRTYKNSAWRFKEFLQTRTHPIPATATDHDVKIDL